MKQIINTFFLIVTLLSLGACESSHIALIRIDASILDEAIQITDSEATSLSEIQSIVNEVCVENGLVFSPDKNDDGILYSRYWGSANDTHPNTLYMSLNQNYGQDKIIEISIFEWETRTQTKFGQKIQSHLLQQLKTFVPEQEITLETL